MFVAIAAFSARRAVAVVKATTCLRVCFTGLAVPRVEAIINFNATDNKSVKPAERGRYGNRSLSGSAVTAAPG
jgi:hypothetical protein